MQVASLRRVHERRPRRRVVEITSRKRRVTDWEQVLMTVVLRRGNSLCMVALNNHIAPVCGM